MGLLDDPVDRTLQLLLGGVEPMPDSGQFVLAEHTHPGTQIPLAERTRHPGDACGGSPDRDLHTQQSVQGQERHHAEQRQCQQSTLPGSCLIKAQALVKVALRAGLQAVCQRQCLRYLIADGHRLQ
ncbi:hypothetical protein D3C81_1651940 [compost metagenome]